MMILVMRATLDTVPNKGEKSLASGKLLAYLYIHYIDASVLLHK